MGLLDFLKEKTSERKQMKEAEKEGFKATFTKAKETKLEKKQEEAYKKGVSKAERKAEGAILPSFPKASPEQKAKAKKIMAKIVEKGTKTSERMATRDHQIKKGTHPQFKPPTQPIFTGGQRPGLYPMPLKTDAKPATKKKTKSKSTKGHQKTIIIKL